MDTTLLESRRKEILGAIISAYLETGQPVSSKYLCQHYKLRLSSATVRNAMGDLEENGLITHPHTSAGRIPTDKGYEYYIQALLSERQPESIAEWLFYQEQIKDLVNLEEVMHRATQILAELTHHPAMATTPAWGESTVKHFELVPLGLDQALMVITTYSGMLKNFVLSLSEETSKRQLEQLNNFLNNELGGMSLSDLENFLNRRLLTVEDSLFYLFKEAREIIRKTYFKILEEEVFFEGRHYLFEQADFLKTHKLKEVVQFLEDKEKILQILQVDLENRKDKINVRIGKKGLGELLQDLSLVSSSYQVKNLGQGSLAVLGPKRMAYPKVISAVESMSKAVTLALGELCKE
jgi:heat-inducible transcriptional repressor